MTRLIFLATAFLLFSSSGWAQGPRNVNEYNLRGGVGLKSYDPVAVFPEGGGAPLMGRPELRLEYHGVTYFFAAEANRNMFLLKPEMYEPTYGGWCAYAMASGAKVDIQPQIFTLHGNRAHYFVSSRAKQNFDHDLASYETRADDFWKRISGEDPRL